jgi:hypothetical protein
VSVLTAILASAASLCLAADPDSCPPLPPPILHDVGSDPLRAVLKPEFSWEPVDGATSYTITIACEDGTPAPGSFTVAEPSFSGLTLGFDESYAWTVTANNACGQSPTSRGPSVVVPSPRFDHAIFPAIHNSYSGNLHANVWCAVSPIPGAEDGERGSIQQQLDGGIRGIEYDIWAPVPPLLPDFILGHSCKGNSVEHGIGCNDGASEHVGNNPCSDNLRDWLNLIASWSTGHPDHAPITLSLDIKETLTITELGALNHELEDVFGDKLFTMRDWKALPATIALWSSIEDLRGRILIVLSGDERDRVAYSNDPSVGQLAFVNYGYGDGSMSDAVAFWDGGSPKAPYGFDAAPCTFFSIGRQLDHVTREFVFNEEDGCAGSADVWAPNFPATDYPSFAFYVKYLLRVPSARLADDAHRPPQWCHGTALEAAGQDAGGGGCEDSGLVPLTGLAVTGEANSVHLTWDDYNADERDIRIQRTVNGGEWEIAGVVPGGTTSATMNVGTGPQGISYCFRVHATDTKAKSCFSNTACITMFNTPPGPEPPEHLQPSGCTTTLRPSFSWDAQPRTQSHYFVLEDTSGTTLVDNPMVGVRTSYPKLLSSDLLPNWDYMFKVKACNNWGCGPWSPYRHFSTLCTPPQPPYQIAAGPKLHYHIALAWLDDSPEASFTIERRDGPDGPWGFVASVPRRDEGALDSPLTYEDTVPPSPPGGFVTYTYRITALNHWGTTAGTKEVDATMYAEAPSEAPPQRTPAGCVTTKLATYNPRFDWDPPARSLWYDMLVHDFAGNTVWEDVPTLDSTTGNLALSGSATYSWQVEAINNQGRGPLSTPKYFAGCAPEDLPIFEPAGCIDSLRPRIRWQPVTGSTSHRLIMTRVSNNTRVVDASLGAFANSYAVPFDLVPGVEYAIQVSASPSGTGSRTRYFTPMCSQAAVPGSAALESPLGGGDAHTSPWPLFIWNEATGASEYVLQVKSSTTHGIVSDPARDRHPAAELCASGQCAIPLSAPRALGCHPDDPANLELPNPLAPKRATVEACIVAARNAGYRYAGLQGGSLCYAGDTLTSPAVADAECGSPCDDDPDEICGGIRRNSVWQVPTKLRPDNYEWQVQAIGPDGVPGPWSRTGRFVVGN